MYKKLSKAIYLTFISCFLSFALYALDEKPQLILHFDVNRTLFMLDPASNKSKADCLIHTLADKYEDCWDERVKEPICYTDYIKEYVYPGIEAGNMPLRRIRKEQISQFLVYLKQTNHRFAEQAQSDFDRAFVILDKQTTLVLTAFYRLLEYLEQNQFKYSIALRTFGSDLDAVIADIESQTKPGFFTVRGKFDAGILNFEFPKELQTINSITEFYTFLKTHTHVAISDDWAPWNRSKENPELGKLFPVDLDDKTVLSLFFDDNVCTKPDAVKNIVNPRDIHTGKPYKVYDLIQRKRIFSVDSVDAILDEQYFIKLVNEAINLL